MPKMAPINLARYNKLWVAGVTFAGALISNHVITGRNADVVSAVIGAVGVLGVFAVPNAQTKAKTVRYDPGPNVDWTPVGQGAPHIKPRLTERDWNTFDDISGDADATAKALGRRPAKNAPSLKFADHISSIPDHPITDLAPKLSWPMDHNDTVGCCVVAGLDHYREAVYNSLSAPYTPWTDAEMLRLYQTQNPTFRSWADGGTSRDQGMEIQTFLEYLVKQKVILGFAKVDHANLEEMKAAIYLGLGVVTGEVLTRRNMSERVWNYYPRDPQEGGHCTVSVGYDPKEDQVSWGDLYGMTDSFLENNVEEAWFVITQAHVDHPAFRAGFDLASFAAAYQEITGAPFPVNVTPEPPVPPVIVPPSPATPDDQHLWALVSTWTAGGHGSTTRAVAAALKEWAKAKQLT